MVAISRCLSTFGHCKFIAYDSAAELLLDKAGLLPLLDEACVHLCADALRPKAFNSRRALTRELDLFCRG